MKTWVHSELKQNEARICDRLHGIEQHALFSFDSNPYKLEICCYLEMNFTHPYYQLVPLIMN